MKILIACEWSGITREAFMRKGHDVVSCDLLAGEGKGEHIQDDVRNLLHLPWDLLIAYPTPNDKDLMASLSNARINKIAIENPRSNLPKHGITQLFSPYPNMKCTALWLKGLEPLIERMRRGGGVQKIIKPTDDRTDRWLAETMAKTWG